MDPQEDVKKGAGRWSEEEHQRFMLGITQFGKDWKKVQKLVGTRTGAQVRSHAQKFFNKLQKQGQQSTKGKRSIMKSKEPEEDDIEQNSFLQGVIQEDLSNATPLELVSLIKKQSRDTSKYIEDIEKVNLKHFKKSLEQEWESVQKIEEKQQLLEHQPMKDNSGIKRLSSFKSMNNILNAYQNATQADNKQFEDQSFLILLTKKYKKFFQHDPDFLSKMIDFGQESQVHNAIKLQKSARKKSFTLVEGIEGGDDALDQILKKIKAQPEQTPESKKSIDNQIEKQKAETKATELNKKQNESSQNQLTENKEKEVLNSQNKSL